MNSEAKQKLEKMLDSGACELTEEELKSLVEAEVSKPEDDIDTEYIDMCFALMALSQEKPDRNIIKLRSSAKLLLIACAVIVLFVSASTVTAQVFNINPIEKIVESIIPASEVTSTTKKPEKKTIYYKPKATEKKVKSYEVPDFIGNQISSQEILENEEWNRHFDIELVGEYSSEYDEGTIMTQSISAGERVKKGTRLVLTYSLGLNRVELPDVVGLTIEEGAEILSEAGFEVNVDMREDMGDIVVSMSCNAGEMAEYGSAVTLRNYICAESDDETTEEITSDTTEISSQIVSDSR